MAPSVIPQLILSLCAVSIATVNKICDIMNPLNGVHTRPRINVKIKNTTMAWLFDTGAACTCIPQHVFNMLYPNAKPPNAQTTSAFKSANGGQLRVLGAYNLPLEIRGRTYEQKVFVLENLTDCILGIDFQHTHKARYDPVARRIEFVSAYIEALTMCKETIVPAFSSKVIKTSFKGTRQENVNYVASVASPMYKTLSGAHQWVTLSPYNTCQIVVDNCSPDDITLARGQTIGFLEPEIETPIPFNNEQLTSVLTDIAAVTIQSDKKISRESIEKRLHLNVPAEFRQKYIDVLYKHQKAISQDKFDLGLATSFTHKIHLKDNMPVYRKQFKIPEAHQSFIEQTLDEWLKLGVVRRSNSLYNSPIFCVPKKQGQGLRIVQDFRDLNNHTHTDKYSMKEIHECIGDIGRSNSNIFSTLDLTSGFWQMPLDDKARHLTAFTIPGKGQFEWITSPMGLLGCPASFQRLMEMVLRNIKQCIVYIDDLLIHSATHEEHLKVLQEVLERLETNNLKINLDKCIFGNTSVNYLGFVLTPQGIKPGKNKLQAIIDSKPPTDIKMVRSFLGLCNFFRSHIKNFAQLADPLYKCTRKDSDYKKGDLPEAASRAFDILKRQLSSEPTMAYPRSDRQYALITDASTGSATEAGGMGAILTQMDKNGQFYAISYASRQLKQNEKNYSPFLLEAAAGVWGMEHFHEYLKGKQFILYTDHKPLEKLSHLHSKTMNRLQAAMLEYDFVIQYKKGEHMPADFFSRQYSDANVNTVTDAFDPFQPDLVDLQKQDQDLQIIDWYLRTGKWNQNIPKQRLNSLVKVQHKVFQDKNRFVWIRLEDYNYPRVALWLPEKYRKQALCEAHNNITGGHNAALKTYIKITSSYWWPNIYSHCLNHAKTCETCQFRKSSLAKNVPLQPLPIPDEPNYRIHADLFGPMTAINMRKKYVLCITDAFTKFAVVTAIDNKGAETVARAIFEQWFCKFGIPAQLHTDQGKEFCNKLSNELMTLLNVRHTTTTPAHPQCNAAVEVFNKTVKKYLNSYVDDSTFNWEDFIPALAFAYNTSYHSTISTTPFELLFGVKARMPSLPSPDIQRIHYGETFAAERYNILNKARQLAKMHAEAKNSEYKNQHDKHARPHSFKIGQNVMLQEMNFLHKNPKLARQWSGPHIIVDINDTNATIRLHKTNKLKVVNVQRIKPFFQETQSQHPFSEELDFSPNDAYMDARPMTRAQAKLIKLQQQLKETINLISSMEDADKFEDADAQLSISAISEDLREYLTSIARKLLITDEDVFDQLTPEEQAIWTSFPTADIYEFITGLPDEVPEFRYDWITTSGAIFTPAPQALPATQPPTDQPQLPARRPQPDLPTPAPPLQQPQPLQQKQSKFNQILRQRRPVNYKEMHEGKSVFKFAAERASKRWSKVTKSVPSLFGSPSSSQSASK